MRRSLRSLLALAATVVVAPPAAVSASEAPVIFAHRGGAAIAPENTLGAFRQAHDTWDADGVWIELDVQLAADGELVVIHDATLDRTTNCTGRVVDKTSTQLQDCDARGGWPTWGVFEPVPTLRAVFTEGRDEGWRLMVELKNIPTEPNFDPVGADAATALVTLLDETGFPADRLLVQSFFPTSLDQTKLARPDVRVALLTISQLPSAPPAVGFWASKNGVYATARGYEVTAPDHSAPDLSAETVAAIQALGREVVVWTVNQPEHIARAASWGVDGIITDRPDLAFELLANAG